MSVSSNNSSASPMSLRSVYCAAPITPTRITTTDISSQPDNIIPTGLSDKTETGISIPVQVIGLVPVFNCCTSNEVFAGFVIANGYADCGSIIFTITIEGVVYGPVSIGSALTDNQIEAAILAVLPAGYTVNCQSSSAYNHVITIYPPAPAADHLGDTLVVTQTSPDCSGDVMYQYNFIAGENFSNCDPECDCREFPSDTIPNDQDFVLPVFASLQCDDAYHNDTNSFLFEYRVGYSAITSGDFLLQEFTTSWNTIATLNNSTYGTAYNNNFFTQPGFTTCTNINYQGYTIDWRKVLSLFGEGMYRFRVASPSASTYCFNSPAFCLKTFDCDTINGTVKFETEYSGGSFGSVTTQGEEWKMCCTNYNSTTKIDTVPISWADSIRFAGFFGRESYEKQRDFIKYATGEINRVRDELVKNFDLRTDKLPMWLHQRFAAYGLMADKLYVSDYNNNNDHYNYKHFWVVDDSGYGIDHKNYTRYPKIKELKFKEGRQLIYRDRCC